MSRVKQFVSSLKESKVTPSFPNLNDLLIQEQDINERASEQLKKFILHEFNEIITQLYNQGLIVDMPESDITESGKRIYSNSFELSVFYVMKQGDTSPRKIMNYLDSVLQLEIQPSSLNPSSGYSYRLTNGLIFITARNIFSYERPCVYFNISLEEADELNLKELND